MRVIDLDRTLDELECVKAYFESRLSFDATEIVDACKKTVQTNAGAEIYVWHSADELPAMHHEEWMDRYGDQCSCDTSSPVCVYDTKLGQGVGEYDGYVGWCFNGVQSYNITHWMPQVLIPDPGKG